MVKSNGPTYTCSNKKCYRHTNPLHGCIINPFDEDTEESDVDAGYYLKVKDGKTIFDRRRLRSKDGSVRWLNPDKA